MRRDSDRKNIWFWVAVALAGLVVVQGYVAYKFPIKQDRYGHAFRTNQFNRLTAYALLLRSGHKFERYDADRIDAIIEETAARHGADPALIKAIAWYESDYLSNAISTTGAMGLMALMPETARALGVRDPFDPAENIDAGVRLVLMLAAEFEGDAALILAGYNAGMGIVKRSGGVPPYPETTAYVRNVSRIYRSLRPEPLPPTASTALIRADDTK